MLLETLMGFQYWRWKWSPLKRNPGGSQVCLCVAKNCKNIWLFLQALQLCAFSGCLVSMTHHIQHVQYFECFVVCVGADLSDYFNYGFNEDTWKAYCEKQKRLRMGLEVSTVGSVTSKITVRDHSAYCVLVLFVFLSTPSPFHHFSVFYYFEVRGT